MVGEPNSVRRPRSGNLGSRGRRRALIGDEAGQSLILVVLCMVLIVALAAFSIDVGRWQVAHHKTQVAADATALAAANCLASRSCTSIAAGGDAEQKGDQIAADNGFPAAEVTVSFTSSTVKATLRTVVNSAFAGFFGIGSENVSASAVASYTNGVRAPASVFGADCSNPTNPPTSGCTVNCTAPGVTISSNGNTNITGAIETNGYVDINIGGTASLGPVESGFGVGTTCGKNTSKVGGTASIANGPADATGFTPFPTTYNSVWTNATSNECSASSTYTASGYPGYKNISVSGGTGAVPSTVTLDGNNKTFGSASAPVVICASTSISIPGNSATLNDITLVAPSISIGGNNFTITPDPNALPDGGGSPAVALYDTSATPLNFGPNDINVTGCVYAPLAGIVVPGNNGGQALLEANTVEIDGNNGGDGPSTTLTAFSGSDQLTQ